jgi:hypothetical protein
MALLDPDEYDTVMASVRHLGAVQWADKPVAVRKKLPAVRQACFRLLCYNPADYNLATALAKLLAAAPASACKNAADDLGVHECVVVNVLLEAIALHGAACAEVACGCARYLVHMDSWRLRSPVVPRAVAVLQQYEGTYDVFDRLLDILRVYLHKDTTDDYSG